MKKDSGISVQQVKEILKKNNAEEISDEQAEKTLDFMQMLAEIAVAITMEDQRRNNRLKESPKGFLFDKDGYSCQLCHQPAKLGNAWFDKFGLKCGACQKAVNEHVIPGALAKDHDTWYSCFEMEYYFNLKRASISKYIKQGLLKPRIIKDARNLLHLQLFLVKDNIKILPPKKLLNSVTASTVHRLKRFTIFKLPEVFSFLQNGR